MYQASIKNLAISLREEGYSYKYISNKTAISKATLSSWLSNIEYEPNQETILDQGQARAAAGKMKSDVKLKTLELTRKKAVSTVGKINKRDLFIFGLALYLGEGSKIDGIVRITNSDPKIIKAVIEWFKILGVANEQFKARIHLYPDSNQKECIAFWATVTKLEKDQFYKPFIDKRLFKKNSNSRKLPYGTIHITVNSGGKKEFGVLFSRSIAAWSNEVLNQINAGLV